VKRTVREVKKRKHEVHGGKCEEQGAKSKAQAQSGIAKKKQEKNTNANEHG
jgi:hypothetical protein